MDTSEFSQGTNIDLMFDISSYNKYFNTVDVDEILERHPKLGSLIQNESHFGSNSETKVNISYLFLEFVLTNI